LAIPEHRGFLYRPFDVRWLYWEADHHIVESNVGMLPLYLRSDHKRSSLFDHEGDGEPRPNLSMEEQVVACLGVTTRDIYLNNIAYWCDVPSSIWEYTIGSYQVIKKWLSYREHALLGRTVTTDEAREVTYMARRIAAIVLLCPALDANYLAVK
jgi:hypothetical protein